MSPAQLLVAVVDDEDSIRKALQRLLRSAGMAVVAFSTGTAFLEALPACKPDCLVLDLHMPLMTGFDVQAKLAQAGAHLPVVIITGHDTPESRARAIAGGANAYLLKPIDDLLLIESITEAVAAQMH